MDDSNDPTSIFYDPFAHLDTICARVGCYRVIDSKDIYCDEHAPPPYNERDWCSVCDQWLWTFEEAANGKHDNCS